MSRWPASLCLAICIAPVPGSAWALLDSCSVSSSGVSFSPPSYDPFDYDPTYKNGTITVTCFGLLGGIFTVDLSTGGSGSYAQRKMYKGTDSLDYNLYVDSGYATVWGDGSGGTGRQSINCILACLAFPNVFDVYGRITARQLSAVPGSYSDTITVTVTF